MEQTLNIEVNNLPVCTQFYLNKLLNGTVTIAAVSQTRHRRKQKQNFAEYTYIGMAIAIYKSHLTIQKETT